MKSVAGLVFLSAVACSMPTAGTADPPTPAPPAPATGTAQSAGAAAASSAPVRSVRVVRPEPVEDDASFASSLYIERDVKVAARRTGVIEKVLVDRGDAVRAGAPLAQLEDDLAAGDVQIADQEMRLAQAEYDRMRPLFEQKVVSQQDWQRAEIALDQARTKTTIAKAWLERCTVRAPFDGVVAERWAVAGQRVVEDDGTPLFRVVAREPLRARVDVPEEAIAFVKTGGRARVSVSGESDARAGRVVFVGPAADAASGTVPVIVEIAPASGALRPGVSARVVFDKPPGARPAVRVPLDAFAAGAAREGQDASLLVVEEGRAAERRVHVVRSRGSGVVLLGDLRPTDLVIVGAGLEIGAGDRVKTRDGAP